MTARKTTVVDHATGEVTEVDELEAAVVRTSSDDLAALTKFLLGEGVNTQPDPATIARAIMGEATIDGGDPEDTGKAIVARLLLAESVDEALAQNNVAGAEVMLGANIEVHNVKWMPSSYDKGPKVYALMDVTEMATGQRRTVSCGSASVLAQLLRIQVTNEFPQVVKIVQATRATAAGNYPMWLERGERPQVQPPMPF